MKRACKMMIEIAKPKMSGLYCTPPIHHCYKQVPCNNFTV